MADLLGKPSKVLCNFCKSGAVNKRVQCKNCKVFYHNSCAVKSTKKCCDDQHLESVIEEKRKSSILDAIDGESNMDDEGETSYLKVIISELRSKIHLLEENKKLWMEKAKYLEEKLKLQERGKPKEKTEHVRSSISMITTVASATDTSKNGDNPDRNCTKDSTTEGKKNSTTNGGNCNPSVDNELSNRKT